MEMFQKSHSLDLDLGKSGKFEFAPDRNRNDSGCFDDFDAVSGSGSPQDPVVTYWDEAINQWSERARSVIAQEVVRMNELTKKSKRELQKTDDRDKVHKAWKQHMRETMDLALDLMKCVSYDILEEFGFEPAPVEDYRKSEKHLTRIAEEESADEGLTKPGGGKNGHSRVVIIRVDHRIRRVPLKRRGVVRSPFAKSAPKVAGKSKLSKSTMTMMLEELKELRKMVGMKKSMDTAKEVWGCKQCLSNPTSWKELSGGGNFEEVEDIFNDWVRMLKKEDIHINADINDVFWNISFDKDKVRTRRLSEVIEDMPFEDRPDIFQDRCEILESEIRFLKKKPPVKSYWNIFSDWKSNLKEPARPMSDWEILERKKNAQNLGRMDKEVFLDQEDYLMDWRQNLVPKKKRPLKRRRPLEQKYRLMICSRVFDEKRKSRGRKRKAKRPEEQEDYFEDWRQNFIVKSKREAKRDLRRLNQEDYFLVWRQVFLDPTPKAAKMCRKMRNNLEQEDYFVDWRKNLDPTGIRSLSGTRHPSPEDIFEEWRPLAFDRDPRHRRRSIDELEEEDEVVFITSPFKKIKHDFQAKKRASAKSMAYKFGRVYQGMRRNFLISAAGLGDSKLEDNFDFWSSDSTVQSLIDSRMEFCRLRFEMRKQRQVNREMNAVIAPESWFEDWRWNMDDESVCASAKRRASDPVQLSPEKIFSDWRRISLDHQTSSSATADTFNEWMRNLKDRVSKKRMPETFHSTVTEMREKLSSPPKPPTTSSSSSTKFCGVISLPSVSGMFRAAAENRKNSKSLKHPQTGKNPADKHTMKLMAKCHAKQPFGRGRN